MVDEVPSFYKLILHYFVQTRVLVASRFAFPQILSCAKLPEVLRHQGTDILEQFEGDSSNFLFIGLKVEENDGMTVVLLFHLAMILMIS